MFDFKKCYSMNNVIFWLNRPSNSKIKKNAKNFFKNNSYKQNVIVDKIYK